MSISNVGTDHPRGEYDFSLEWKLYESLPYPFRAMISCLPGDYAVTPIYEYYRKDSAATPAKLAFAVLAQFPHWKVSWISYDLTKPNKPEWPLTVAELERVVRAKGPKSFVRRRSLGRK